MVDLHELAKVIADNLPSPYALDTVWEQIPGPERCRFNLNEADEGSRAEWVEMAAAVLGYVLKSTNSKLADDGSILPAQPPTAGQ